MLEHELWLRPGGDLAYEIEQARREGREQPEELLRRAAAAEQMSGAARDAAALPLYEEIQRLPMRPDYPYWEPDDLEDILAACPAPGAGTGDLPPRDALEDKLYGGWLGRCSGCLLGQPVEGWYRPRIQGLLKDTGNLPIRRYLSSDIAPEAREKYGVNDDAGPYDADCTNWINNVHCMPEDDDTNYTILGLKLLERKGKAFTSEDAAQFWLINLPILHTCSAERVAYINFCNLVPPPRSAVTRNPYREWIGAQIRADIFGYVCPGNPREAAALAWKEARISHVKNGVYGAMLVAAMLAAAFTEGDLTKIIAAGLGEIPAKSRLAEGVRTVLAWYSEGVAGPEAVARVHAMYDETYFYDWCHTVPNAMLVCLCLLYGGYDFTKTIGMAVEAGFDTDCNGATAGSILGVVLGAKKLPTEWVAPLNDRVYSAVHGFYDSSISDLAMRTMALIEKG